jgi:hypothetical protein
MVFGIDVIIIGPGAVVTAIWDKAEATDIGYLAGTVYEGPCAGRPLPLPLGWSADRSALRFWRQSRH